ncbi:MAG: hypothetical protein Q7S57_02910 [bacterium]|nr:hypothetical protein [bacterium]
MTRMERVVDWFLGVYFPFITIFSGLFFVVWVYLTTRPVHDFPEWGFVLFICWVVVAVPALPLMILTIIQEKIRRMKDEAQFYRDCYVITFCDEGGITEESAVETGNPYQSPIYE